MDLPTADEKKATELLLAELRRQKTFEAPAETEKRYAADLSTLKCPILTRSQESST